MSANCQVQLLRFVQLRHTNPGLHNRRSEPETLVKSLIFMVATFLPISPDYDRLETRDQMLRRWLVRLESGAGSPYRSNLMFLLWAECGRLV